MEMRVDGVERLRSVGIRYRKRIDWIGWVRDGRNFLVDPVLMDRLDDIGRACVGAEAVGHGEALVEPAIPGTQHSLRSVLCIGVPQGVGEREPRRPVAL